jgi:hypothetical protein
MAGVTPEVEVLHASPVNPARLRPPPRLYGRTCSPKETDATLRKEQVQIVYEIVCIVFGEDRFRPSLPELLTVCKVSFVADPGDAQGKLSGKVAPKAASPVLPLLIPLADSLLRERGFTD